MEWLISNILKNSKATIKISLTTIVVVLIVVFYLMTGIDDIPAMKKDIKECKDLTVFIPDMKENITWLVRKQGGVPAEDRRNHRGNKK